MLKDIYSAIENKVKKQLVVSIIVFSIIFLTAIISILIVFGKSNYFNQKKITVILCIMASIFSVLGFIVYDFSLVPCLKTIRHINSIRKSPSEVVEGKLIDISSVFNLDDDVKCFKLTIENNKTRRIIYLHFLLDNNLKVNNEYSFEVSNNFITQFRSVSND